MEEFKEIFLFILNMSITSTYVALAIIIIRIIFLKKVPKIYSYALWSILLFRLCCPITFSSDFSFFNFIKPEINNNSAYMKYIPSNIDFMETPTVDVGVNSVNNLVNTSLPKATEVASINPMQVITLIATTIWLLGLITLILYSTISYLKLISNTKSATLYNSDATDVIAEGITLNTSNNLSKNNSIVEATRKINMKRKIKIFESAQIQSPYVCGLIKPKIYIPKNLSQKELSYILLHELVHIKRADYLLKAFAYLILILHWFNPVMWISFSLMSKDMEMSCDEKVLSILGNDIKKDYSNSLLSLAVNNNKLLQGSPLAFGESNVKSRIKNVLKFEKLSSSITIAVVILIAILGYILMANPTSLNMDKNFYPKSIEIDLVGDMQIIDFTEEDSSKITELLQYDKWQETKMEYDLAPMTYISDKTADQAINGESQKVIGLYEDVDGYTFIKLYSGFGLKDSNYYRAPMEVYSEIKNYLANKYFTSEDINISSQFKVEEPIMIVTNEKDFVKIGEMLFDAKIREYMNGSVDDSNEILSYNIKDSGYLAGTKSEFGIYIVYDLIPKIENSNWQAGNGINNAYRELRIKNYSNIIYELADFGTGGAAVDLPVAYDESEFEPSIILKNTRFNGNDVLLFNKRINSEEDLIATKVHKSIFNNTSNIEEIRLSSELIGYSLEFKINDDYSDQYLLGYRIKMDNQTQKLYTDLIVIDKENLGDLSILQSYSQNFATEGGLSSINDFNGDIVGNYIIYKETDGYWSVQDILTKTIYTSDENISDYSKIEPSYSETNQYITILKYKEDNSYLVFDKINKNFSKK